MTLIGTVLARFGIALYRTTQRIKLLHLLQCTPRLQLEIVFKETKTVFLVHKIMMGKVQLLKICTMDGLQCSGTMVFETGPIYLLFYF